VPEATTQASTAANCCQKGLRPIGRATEQQAMTHARKITTTHDLSIGRLDQEKAPFRRG
jgi:hypothetical protein